MRGLVSYHEETVSFGGNMKKRVVCFGDSNTWGYIPGSDHQRYDENENLKSVAEYQQSSNMKRYFEIEELKKENASLKDALEGYKQNAKWCDKCDKIVELEKENATLKKQLEALSGDTVIDLRDRAEQFLSEEEK